MIYFIQIVQLIINILTWIILLHVVLSYFMSPYHPVRLTIARIIEPLMAPIRRVVPPVGVIDFTPVVLMVILQVIGYLLNRLLLGS